MQISQDGIKMIEGFEGCNLHAYRDSGGYLTIGTGHLCHPQDGFTDTSVITQAKADDLLEADLTISQLGVNSLVTVPLTQSQYDALVSLTFNMGTHNLAISSLLAYLNEKQYQTAGDCFTLYDRSAGKVIHGLVLRRAKERQVFLDGYGYNIIPGKI